MHTVPEVGRVRLVGPEVEKVKLLLPISRVWLLSLSVPVPVAMILPFIVAAERIDVLIVLVLIVKALTLPLVPLTWNLAVAVEFPPTRRSKLVLIGDTAPASCCHQLVPVAYPQLLVERQSVPDASGNV